MSVSTAARRGRIRDASSSTLVPDYQMPPGVLFALCAYALYSCCDAIVKGLGSGLSVYEIAFFTTLFSLLPALFMTPKGESWLTFWKLRNPLLLHLRGLSGVIGNLCIIFAFVSIPLAEAYSLAFLAPIFIVFISVWLLGREGQPAALAAARRQLCRRADRRAPRLPRFEPRSSGGGRGGGLRRGDHLGAAPDRQGRDASQPHRRRVALYPRGQRRDDDAHRQRTLAELAGSLVGC